MISEIGAYFKSIGLEALGDALLGLAKRIDNLFKSRKTESGDGNSGKPLNSTRVSSAPSKTEGRISPTEEERKRLVEQASKDLEKIFDEIESSKEKVALKNEHLIKELDEFGDNVVEVYLYPVLVEKGLVTKSLDAWFADVQKGLIELPNDSKALVKASIEEEQRAIKAKVKQRDIENQNKKKYSEARDQILKHCMDRDLYINYNDIPGRLFSLYKKDRDLGKASRWEGLSGDVTFDGFKNAMLEGKVRLSDSIVEEAKAVEELREANNQFIKQICERYPELKSDRKLLAQVLYSIYSPLSKNQWFPKTWKDSPLEYLRYVEEGYIDLYAGIMDPEQRQQMESGVAKRIEMILNA